jgi:hypothetical protein
VEQKGNRRGQFVVILERASSVLYTRGICEDKRGPNSSHDESPGPGRPEDDAHSETG